MANRHLARSVVLQTLFEWDTTRASADATHDILARNKAEFGGDGADERFMETLLAGVLAKKEDLDLIIAKAAPDWPLEKIAPVDRNILRMGLFELLFSDRSQVPAKVAINEAIELAKTFGGDSSGRFVNGVLGAVYKEMSEPGKDEKGKKSKALRREDLPLQKLGGAVVYAKHDGQYYLALVHDVFGHWTLSKGKIGDAPEIEDEHAPADEAHHLEIVRYEEDRHAALLTGYSENIQQVELGEKGTWYRLRVAGLGDREVALALCDRLKADGGACILGK